MFSSSTKIFTELCYLNKNLSKILCSLSLPVRGAWIEIRQNTGMHVSEQIAPCEAGQLLDD